MILAIAFAVTLFLTLIRKDAWPFTRYPMFSHYRDAQDVRIVVLVLEMKDGTIRPWRPHFYRYADRFGELLSCANDTEIVPLVFEALRLIRLEEGQSAQIRAILVRERSCQDFEVQEQTVARIPLC